MKKEVIIIGGGFAGVEAALFLGEKGIRVSLFEMRPKKMTPAHRSELLAEPVCSNSFKSVQISNAHGLLKAEMEVLGSRVLKAARKAQVPAGKALSVDREVFAKTVTEMVEANPYIEVIREEVEKIPDRRDNRLIVLAAGPLISMKLAEDLMRVTGEQALSFYDAIAPTVDAESIDMEYAFIADRYSKEEGSYINCPMDRELYERFIQEILKAEKVQPREFEDVKYFEACLPIEVMAGRGMDVLRYGPMKPVGLIDPKTGKQPYAVVQLRQEDKAGLMYGMVGFQTRMTYPEQKRIFRMIPCLHRARFLRYGSVHRNTFINAPMVMDEFRRLKKRPDVFVAGQLSGVEGYMESAASGILAGLNAFRMLQGKEAVNPPVHTMLGGLVRYLQQASPESFQPMNANFGLIVDPPRLKGKSKKEFMANRALEEIRKWAEEVL